MTIDPIRLTRELIDLPSVTGDEYEVGVHLESLLEGKGFRCRRIPVEDNRFNLFVRTESPPVVLMSTHIDTVPPFFGSSDRDGWVYGRGACDAKGIAAAMAAAAERLIDENRSRFALLFVVGEETDSIGAKKASDALAGLGTKYLINGEPTESRYVSATKGALTATVFFEGVAAHSAYPEMGDSAIRKMAECILAIDTTEWGSDEILGPVTVNVGVVRGGEKPNIVPDSSECQMIFRTVGDPAEVLDRLETLVSGFGGRVIRHHGNPPVHMAVPKGETANVVAFNTDALHLQSLGTPILYGPGSILDAHTERERIAKKDILDAVEQYRDLVVGLIDGTLQLVEG